MANATSNKTMMTTAATSPPLKPLSDEEEEELEGTSGTVGALDDELEDVGASDGENIGDPVALVGAAVVGAFDVGANVVGASVVGAYDDPGDPPTAATVGA